MAQSLFRSIRMKLLQRRSSSYEGQVDEGKTIKYLKYAIGEILLIIVGIMIALQLNNWNEDRKAQVEFDLYIVQLKEDVRSTIGFLDEIAADNDERVREDYRNLIEFLEQPTNEDGAFEAFEASLVTVSHFPQPQVNIGLLGRLLDGDLTIISRNKVLSQEALQLQRRIQTHLDIIDTNKDRMEHSIAVIDRYRARSTDAVPEMRIRYNLEEMKSSLEFTHAVQNILTRKVGVGRRAERIASILESFLTVLEEYE